ncbi:zinc-dependent metalloprotease [Mesonia maritima]|uniref:Secretion system C-terminal sorting domain-containing protein n=1 Tax=Mesonia maritima TaxID=1793873 RepID=A0ABU1K530_9FLAO|nr:zinc-dependent metalloprotease family protein [Mesonia maritima]MDR6300725.1 hypothetical protein [Mesonia maritima]
MKKTLLSLVAFLISLLGFSQNYWTKISAPPSQKNILNKNLEVTGNTFYSLNNEAFVADLNNAPFRNSTENSPVKIAIPIGENEFKSFEIFKTRTLSKELAAKFPSIQSFIGTTSDKKNNLRLTITPHGIFGMVSTGAKLTYINPNSINGNIYTVFKKNSITETDTFLNCLVASSNNFEEKNTPVTQADVDDAVLRTYELAVATTGEYAQFHISNMGLQGASTTQQRAGVLSAIAATIDRVNEIYERDLAVTFTLVPDNEDIIFLNPNSDPFSNYNTGQLIGQSQNTIDNIIGSGNYDIGHTFSTGAGGLAQLFSVCNNSVKALGVTGISQPIGDPFAVDYVAHELGHQFGANHTFNGQNGSCSGNENNNTAIEPGSGTTIMAYAGLCPGENIQFSSDPYFHAISIDEIYNNISNGSGSFCPDNSSINNQAPVIQSIPNYTIPRSTAFVLTANASDPDNDQLTYCWEQTDAGFAPSPPSAFATSGALFRSRIPVSSSSRYFPELAQISTGNLDPEWEVIPMVSRSLNFSVTVRDNNPLGGQSSRENVTVNVVNSGPFRILSQNSSGISYSQNESVPIIWNVGGTNGNGINTQTVDIFLSYDSGENFTELVADNVPNDGSHNIVTPVGTASTECRIMVKAVDNIFLTVNEEDFEITTNVLNTPSVKDIEFALYPNPTSGKFTIDLMNTDGKKQTVRIFDINGKLIHQKELNSSLVRHSVELGNPQSGIYLVEISNGSSKIIKKLIIK